MWRDPIVEEVRNAGAKLAEKCGYDFYKFSQMIKEHQDKSDRVVVTKKDLKDKILKTNEN